DAASRRRDRHVAAGAERAVGTGAAAVECLANRQTAAGRQPRHENAQRNKKPSHPAPPACLTSWRVRSYRAHCTVKRLPPVPTTVDEPVGVVIWMTRAPTGALGAMATSTSASVPSGVTEKVTTVMLASVALFLRKLTMVAPLRPAPSTRRTTLGVPGEPIAGDTLVITGWKATATVPIAISLPVGPTWTLTVPGMLLLATTSGSATLTLTPAATNGVDGAAICTLMGDPERKEGIAVTIENATGVLVTPRSSHCAGPVEAFAAMTSWRVIWPTSVPTFWTVIPGVVHTNVAPLKLVPVIVTGTTWPCAPLVADWLPTVVVWLTPLSRVICRML